MPRDLEDEIFGGGESDLSDVEQEPQPTKVADRSDDEYDAPPAEESQGLPKFRKDPTSSRPSGDGASQRQKPASSVRRIEPIEDPDQPALVDLESIPLDPEEQRRQELYDRIDEAAGKGKKGTRRRRKGGEDDLEMMADEEVSRLRTRMLNAVTMDLEANEERRPATAKMMLLPLVTSTMQKSHLETAILDNGVLEAVKKWLEPLPDRSLPALNIQRSLLQLLSKMSIDTQSLKSSELGKVVLFYTKCKRVDPSIKRMADNLVTTWLRPIIRRSASYRSRAPLPVVPISGNPSLDDPRSQSRPSGSTNPARPPPPNPRGSQRARIPETVQQAFQFAPMSQLDANGDDRGAGGGSQNPAARKGSQKATAKKTREWARKVQDAKKNQRVG